MTMTKRIAKKWCLKKWEWYLENPNATYRDMDIAIPEMKEFRSSSAYCETYQSGFDCTKCPLYKLWGVDCNDDNSPYGKWCDAKTPRWKEYWAKRMIDDIKRS